MLQQRLVLLQCRNVIVEIHFVVGRLVQRWRLARWRRKGHRVAGIEQQFYGLHQFVQVKAGCKDFLVLELKVV
ncbi:hypothetical protein D3C87_1789360 [compost metagenome]